MKMWRVQWALAGTLLVMNAAVGCAGGSEVDDDAKSGGSAGDDANGTGGKKPGSGGQGSGGKDASGGKGTGGKASGGQGGESPSSGGEGGEPHSETGGAASGGEGSGGEGSGGGPSIVIPTLPGVLSVSGCEEIQLGPLCSIDQSAGEFVANCGGLVFDGEIDAEGRLDFVAETSDDEGTTQTTECIGELRYGRLRATSCVRTITPNGGAPTEVQCGLVSDPVVQPGVACLDLPDSFDDLVICVEGEESEGQTIDAGDCKVLQDGCNYQVQCENDLVLSGTVSATGISFTRPLAALADAQGETPAFLKGDVVNHSCTATVEGTMVTGSCGAGRQGRNGTNTSVCAVSGVATGLPPTCGLLAPAAEHLLVLDSCEALEEGEGSTPGIGEPVCAVRQNNCVWEVQCGRDLVFEGQLAAGATQLDWTLPTGTPCEIAFNGAGVMTGKCQVPGQPACNLSSKSPVPGGAECPTLPEGTGFRARGCGDAQGNSLECAGLVQHGCNYLASCRFRGIPFIVAGETELNESSGRNRLEFTGLPGWECHAEEANQSDIEGDARALGEWFGDCENEAGGVCRNNYDPESNPTGLRGLQVFFDLPEEL